MQLIHIHIPKTAGTSLRESLAAAQPDWRIEQLIDPAPERVSPEIDAVSGHFSYEDACRYGDPRQFVTVLRHPIDRFMSIYFFWRQLYANDVERTRKTTLAHKLPLREFARAFDEPELVSELYNRTCWQLHSSFRLLKRYEARESRGLGSDALASEVLENLRSFAVVGFQDRYGDFVAALNARFDLDIANRKINVTERRSGVEDLTHTEISAILPWVEADMAVYTAATREFL